ncbi:MAG: acyl-ACP thioesterase domain-containing protein [Ilumatobacter sp.]
MDEPGPPPPGLGAAKMPVVPSVAPAIELLPEPDGGRRFTMDGRVRLGDVDRNGRMRLDATARLLQDVATDDASDAGLDRRFGWLVRRSLIETRVAATIGEPLVVATWCAGTGRSWAERRTRITGERGAAIDAVSLWVQIDIESGRPTRLASDFVDVYGPTAGGRTVTARLALPAPGAESRSESGWTIRRTDLDPFGHVNNAATWAFLEEVARLDETSRVGRAEMEYLQPVEPGDAGIDMVVERADSSTTAWLVTASTTLAAARWSGSFSAG